MMAFWEFLIQKEGDRSWLPLESSTVEILEGRYRIVARSSHSNTGVEIRVTHNATTETPPIRRIQKRASRINADGLLVIMPYTRLSPGTWDLRCTGDLMTDMMGNGWKHAIQLDVQPIELDQPDWEEDWQEEQDDPAGDTHAQPEGQALAQLSLSPVEPLSSPPAAEPDRASHSADYYEDSPYEDSPEAAIATPIYLTAAARPTAAALGETLEITYSADSSLAADPSPHSLRLQLKESNYIVQSEQPLVLTGAIESATEQAPATLTGKLRVRLFNPQTSQMLVDETQSVIHQSLPFPISLTLALPANCETHLILGELALYGQSGGQSGGQFSEPPEDTLPPVLATQSFSVTTDLLELLNAIANDSELAEAPPPSTPSDETQAFLNLRPPIIPAVQFRPAVQQPLPPQLHPADPDKSPRSLDLPAFAKVELPDSKAADKAEDQSGSHTEPDEQTVLAPDLAPETVQQETVQRETVQPKTAQPIAELSGQPTAEAPLASEWSDLPIDLQPQLELIHDTADPAIDWQNSGDHLPYWQQKADADELPSNKAEDVAFRSLNLQERFLSKLQSLAGDVELAEWIGDQEPMSGESTGESTGESKGELMVVERQSSRSPDWDAELTAQEFVVEAPRPYRSPNSEELSRIQALAAITAEPIAVPQLEVPDGELAAGQTIPVMVRLPDSYARVYAKLWMHDRQSRALLDGPHWLMDFTPDGFGNLVVKSSIMVPFGCLEVQFEAIAIDMTNQRESDKVSVVRTVIPPSLTALSIEELED